MTAPFSCNMELKNFVLFCENIVKYFYGRFKNAEAVKTCKKLQMICKNCPRI